MKIDSIEKARYYVGKAEMILKERGLLDEEVQHYENKKSGSQGRKDAVVWGAVGVGCRV